MIAEIEDDGNYETREVKILAGKCHITMTHCIIDGQATALASFFYSPSTDWSQGGPLIEKYKIDITHGEMNILAEIYEYKPEKETIFGIGDPILIAAMRAIVKAKRGKD